MDEFLSLNKGLKRRIKHVFVFKDYSPRDLAKIVNMNLIKQKIRFPYGIDEMVVQCFSDIPIHVRSDLNASLCQDLIHEVRSHQEARLTFDSTYNDIIKYSREDFERGIKALSSKYLNNAKKGQDKGTQTPYEVLLHIPGVGIIPGSPL